MAQKIKNHKTIKAKHQNGDFEMAYEIDFIGVNSEKSTKDADAICMRWRSGVSFDGTATYKIGVVDGGFEAHGDALVAHMNQYYFNDELNIKDITEKSVDFIVITNPDQDHTIGIKKVLENFSVKKIYMNRPWKYVDDLFDKINDGRITKESLARRLREKYKTIADIEDMAKEKTSRAPTWSFRPRSTVLSAIMVWVRPTFSMPSTISRFAGAPTIPSIRRSSRTTRLSSCWRATTRAIMGIWRTSTAA